MAKEPRCLDSKSPTDAKAANQDLVVVGPPDFWKVLSKAYAQEGGFMKSTKAANVPGGVLIQVSTECVNPNGTPAAVAEALVFIAQVRVSEEPAVDGSYRLQGDSIHGFQIPSHDVGPAIVDG
jgi:hypothetical protein